STRGLHEIFADDLEPVDRWMVLEEVGVVRRSEAEPDTKVRQSKAVRHAHAPRPSTVRPTYSRPAPCNRSDPCKRSCRSCSRPDPCNRSAPCTRAWRPASPSSRPRAKHCSRADSGCCLHIRWSRPARFRKRLPRGGYRKASLGIFLSFLL